MGWGGREGRKCRWWVLLQHPGMWMAEPLRWLVMGWWVCCRTWEQLLKLHSADAVFKGTVTGVNKGGAIVLVDGLRAFLPGSHLSGVYADDSLVGQELPLKFLEVRRQEQRE